MVLHCQKWEAMMNGDLAKKAADQARRIRQLVHPDYFGNASDVRTAYQLEYSYLRAERSEQTILDQIHG